jgi:Transglutaminase-like superfamily
VRRIALCAAVFALLAARVCLILGAGRTVRIAARVNNPRDPRPVNPRDPRLVNNPRDPRPVLNPRDRRLVDDPRDPRPVLNPRDRRLVDDPPDPRPVWNPRNPRPALNHRDPRPANAARIRDLCWAVTVIGARPPFSATCLEQGVALVMLLTIARIPAKLVVGVTRAESAFRAHAWVECGGVVVLGGAQSQGFTPLLRAPAHSRPSAVSASCPG